MKIAIQGIKGSFHHIVAENYFGEDVELMECMTFSEMPDLVLNESVDAAVMAIENSIAGAQFRQTCTVCNAALPASCVRQPRALHTVDDRKFPPSQREASQS